MTRPRARAGEGQVGHERHGDRPTVGEGRRAPRGVHPEPWRLAETLLAARSRLPYATAEARLLDGLQRWVALESKAPADGHALAPVGPRWALVLAAVTATARLCSAETQTMLAPWTGGGATAPTAGVSPHAAVAFHAFGLDDAGGGA